MQLMILNALSAGLLVAVTCAGMAQELPRPPELLRTRFCIGSGNCPVTVQVMKNLRFGCSSDCARNLYNSSGRRREPRTRISTASGGQQRETEEDVVTIGIRLSASV